jgi:hypothetical protein
MDAEKKLQKIAKNCKKLQKIAKNCKKFVEKMAFRHGRRSAVGDVPPWATFRRGRHFVARRFVAFCRATFSRGTDFLCKLQNSA